VLVLPIQGNVYLLATGGGNVTAQIGPEGVLLVDTAAAAMSDAVLAAIRKLSDQPIRWIVNTAFDADHTGGNAPLERAGSATPQNQFGSGRAFPGALPSGATIVAHESVLSRMSAPTGETPPAPQAAWPVATYFGEGRELFFNGEAIQVFHEPSAHTDGDSIVYFRHSDVICAGDIFNMDGFPVIDLKTRGTINGVIAGLNHVLDIAIPREKQEGGTYVVPGHGRIGDEADVVAYRNMVTIIRDRIRDMMKKGMTLTQIKAAKPTAGYDRRWSTPAWTSDMFVEAAYATLTPPAAAQR
jgi:glyoxylase-like metal-dependent hydrolase (beta-lactamase superfamily II)